MTKSSSHTTVELCTGSLASLHFCGGTRLSYSRPLGSELQILCALELDTIEMSLHEMLVGDISKVKAALLDDARERLNQLSGDPATPQSLAAQPHVVVGKHGTHIAEELLLGSVTKHVLAESQCDVLVICDSHEAPDESS